MSELQVYVEGDKVVVCVSGMRMSFSPDIAIVLRDMLDTHIPIAQTEVENIRARYKVLLSAHELIENVVGELLLEQRQIINDLVFQGHFEVAVTTAAMLLGEEHKYDYFATYWIIDDTAQYHLRAEWNTLGAELLRLISLASKSSLVGQLWKAGSFDNSLFLHCSKENIVSSSELGQRIVWLSHMMQFVPKSEFWMGDNSIMAWDFEQPVHKVQLNNGFWVGRYAVTQQLYESIMQVNPSDIMGAFLPVSNVSWFDSVLFCNRLSEQEGLQPSYSVSENTVTWNQKANGYRLLTEAEWEYSAKGTSLERESVEQFSGSTDSDEVAWTKENSENLPHSVGAKLANSMGLYDMSGNIWEWCFDWYDPEYYSSSRKPDPIGPKEGEMRVCRGGSYLALNTNARVSLRGRFEPTTLWKGLGFRIAKNQ
jgi:formylglycine-generating enzyme